MLHGHMEKPECVNRCPARVGGKYEQGNKHENIKMFHVMNQTCGFHNYNLHWVFI